MLRRVPLQRSGFKPNHEPSAGREPKPMAGGRAERPHAKGSSLNPAPSRCKHCKGKFTAEERARALKLHPACEEGFADGFEARLERQRVKEAKAAAKGERASDKVRKEAGKRMRDLLADAQVAFNAYIRARDAGTTCICCGKPFEPQKPGGSMDAGHYLGRAIAPQHRFNENNVFGQRKNCNRPGGTTRLAFRAGVIGRIGLPALEALEADTAFPKWTREQLIALKTTYRAKTRELLKARGA